MVYFTSYNIIPFKNELAEIFCSHYNRKERQKLYSAAHNSYKEIPISVEEMVTEIEINAPKSCKACPN